MVAQDEGERGEEGAVEEVPVEEVGHLMGCEGEGHRGHEREAGCLRGRGRGTGGMRGRGTGGMRGRGTGGMRGRGTGGMRGRGTGGMRGRWW